MEQTTSHSRVKFINTDDGSEISAASIQVVLPNNSRFTIESLPGREGAAVVTIPFEGAEGRSFSMFAIEPGAANLFSINVIELPRQRIEDEN